MARSMSRFSSFSFKAARLSPFFFPLAEAILNFDPPVFEIHGKGDEGDPFLLRLFAKIGDLSFMQKELPVASLLMVVDVAELVGRDVAADQPHFIFEDLDVRLLQARVVVAERFDLRAGQNDARLQSFEDLVVVKSFSV